VRILFIANDFPNPRQPTKGPFNLALARALLDRHDVRVIAPIPWIERIKFKRTSTASTNAPASDEDSPSAESPFVGMRIERPTYVYPPRLLRNYYDRFYSWSISGAVAKVLRDFRPDAVLSYWAHPDGAAALRVARAIGVPGAVIVGGSDVLLITRDPGRRRRVADVLKSADAVIAVNAHLKARSIDLGAAPDRAHVWSQGVDDSIFYPGDRFAARSAVGIPPDRPAVLWVGRMAPVKGLDVLLAAMAIPNKLPDDARVYLVGDGPLRAELASKARQLGLADRVIFVGAKSGAVLGDWYRAADVTVLPSRSEGLPNVLRESLACGTPFVASDVGGISEIARDAANRLVPAGDPAALIDALAGALAAGRRIELASKPPTWRESAEAIVKILAKAGAKEGGINDAGPTEAGQPVCIIDAAPRESADSPLPVARSARNERDAALAVNGRSR
jgi:glycosyltransferase involved in cell wall biosynthesis